MSIEEAREQLNKEQLEKEIDTITSTIKDKRRYVKILIGECHNLEEELYKFQKELSLSTLLHKTFKDPDYFYEIYYYYILEVEKDRVKVLQICDDTRNKCYKIEINNFYLKTFDDRRRNNKLIEISSEEFIEVYNKAFENFNDMLPQGE